VYFGLYLVVINCVRERDMKPLWSAIEWTMVVFAVFGIFQSAFLPNFGQMVRPNAKLYLEIDPQGHRLMSTMLEPNIAASMIFIVLLVQLAQLAYGAEVPRWKPALFFVALALTVSRSGAAGFLVGMMVLLSVRGLGKKMWRFLAAMSVVALGALPYLLMFAARYEKLGISDSSAAARVIGWGRAITLFLENPWFGVGFNTYGFVQQHRGLELFGAGNYSVEGGLLFVAVMTGLVGLSIYGLMLYFVFRKCRSVWRDPFGTPEERGLALGAVAGTVGVCVHSLFVNSILTPFVMEPLWVLWGLAFLASANIRRRRALNATTGAA
jgi:O-antigen ligase